MNVCPNLSHLESKDSLTTDSPLSGSCMALLTLPLATMVEVSLEGTVGTSASGSLLAFFEIGYLLVHHGFGSDLEHSL